MSLFDALRPFGRISLQAALETAPLTCDILAQTATKGVWHTDTLWDAFCEACCAEVRLPVPAAAAVSDRSSSSLPVCDLCEIIWMIIAHIV